MIIILIVLIVLIVLILLKLKLKLSPLLIEGGKAEGVGGGVARGEEGKGGSGRSVGGEGWEGG